MTVEIATIENTVHAIVKHSVVGVKNVVDPDGLAAAIAEDWN